MQVYSTPNITVFRPKKEQTRNHFFNGTLLHEPPISNDSFCLLTHKNGITFMAPYFGLSNAQKCVTVAMCYYQINITSALILQGFEIQNET